MKAPSRPLVLLLGLLGACSLVACGRKATPQDCEVIFRKSAQLELRAQNVTDPKVSEERIEAVRRARGDALVQQCTGKRITDGALRCVESAVSPEQLDKCLE